VIEKHLPAVQEYLENDDAASIAYLAALEAVWRARHIGALWGLIDARIHGALQDALAAQSPFSKADTDALRAARAGYFDEPDRDTAPPDMPAWKVAEAAARYHVDGLDAPGVDAPAPETTAASFGRETVWAAIRTLPPAEAEAVEGALLTGADIRRPHGKRGWARLIHPTRGRLVQEW